MPVRHPIFARLYPKVAAAMDRGGMADHRRALLTGLRGEVLEVGAGNGGNFGHYPPEVTGVRAVEPEPRLRALAVTAAATAPVPIEVTDAVAERLPTRDAGTDSAGGYDAVVVSLVLCSVRDPLAALRETHRVLRPGGQLRFLEHVRADTRGMARLQRVLDATCWPLLAGGCHTGRDTAALIDKAGLRIDRIERFDFPSGSPMRTPTSRHILGTAVRPR